MEGGLLALVGFLLMCWRLVLEGTPHIFSVIMLALRTLLLVLALGLLLPIRMFGRMVVWCVMRSRVSAVEGLVCLRCLLGVAGSIALGGTWFASA